MQNRIRQKVQKQVKLGQVDQNVWSTITVDRSLQDELRQVAFTQKDDLGVLRWLMEKGAQGTDFRCSFGWYIITRRGLEYMANRAGVPIELIALTSAIFSTRTAVDLNILATNLWDIDPANVWVYSRFRPDLPKGNIDKFLKMRRNWKKLVGYIKKEKIPANINDLAKVWLFALTRPNWKEIVRDELPSGLPTWLTSDLEKIINDLAKPITMYGKTGNYALNLLGYVGVITVDTHMFKPVFGTNGVHEDLAKLLHKDKELYQSLSEDYTDILEELGDEINIRGSLGFDPSPAGLQSAVWVMRQVAGQDFTRPVNFHRFHRFRDALAKDYLKKRREGTKSKLEHIIKYLKEMAENPKGVKETNQSEVEKWKKALQEEWITPLERFQRGLDQLKEIEFPYFLHPERYREPRRIFSVVEGLTGDTVWNLTPEGMIEQVHTTKTTGRTLLSDIQPILEAELPKLAIQVGLDPNLIIRSIETTKLASRKAQEVVHLSTKDATYRNRLVKTAGQTYNFTIGNILAVLKRAEQQQLTVAPELFLAFGEGSDPATTIHPFWKQTFPESRIEVLPTGGLEVVLSAENQTPIRLRLNTIAKQEGDRWVMTFNNKKYRISLPKPKPPKPAKPTKPPKTAKRRKTK